MGNKLKTSGIPEGSVPKVLQPGNAVIKISGISLKTEPFPGDPVNIILQAEGEPQPPPFEGFAYDKEKPELGNALGQVGKIRATQYNFTNDLIQGKQRDRDGDILKWLKSFCKAFGKPEWLDSQDNAHDTIADLINQMNTDKPFKDIWMAACLAGKAYNNKEGFTNYDLFLPYFKPTAVPLELVGTQPSKMIQFNKDVHILKSRSKAPAVDGFEGKPKGKSTEFDI